MSADHLLSLAGWRRDVASLYAEVRRQGVGQGAWEQWRRGRDAMLATHVQSPVPEGAREGFPGMGFFPYDPSWCLTGVVEAASGEEVRAPDGTFVPVGDVVAEREGQEIRLTLLWLKGYGGGLFLPFRDATGGSVTYGGGRYLLDQAKGADLGALPDGRLVLDFNFAYHPSCAHDPRWTCPLAPPANVLPIPVAAGELLPGIPPLE